MMLTSQLRIVRCLDSNVPLAQWMNGVVDNVAMVSGHAMTTDGHPFDETHGNGPARDRLLSRRVYVPGSERDRHFKVHEFFVGIFTVADIANWAWV